MTTNYNDMILVATPSNARRGKVTGLTCTISGNKLQATLCNALDYIHLMDWVVAEESTDWDTQTTTLYCLTGNGYVDVIVHRDWFEVR